MPLRTSRDDFPPSVVNTLARRVGMRCSNPDCRLPTSGPQVDETKAVNLGVAAHITAAAPGGPRFDPSLAPQQRRAAKNGIWLCQNHAKLVDNDAERYTVELLRGWKKDAEELAHGEVSGTSKHRLNAPGLEAVLFAQNGNPRSSGFTFVLIVSLRNTGHRTVRGVVAVIRHDETHCQGMAANGRIWIDESSDGVLNPKRLRLRQNLNPGEVVPILGIPLVGATPFPFSIYLSLSAEDQPMQSSTAAITAEQAEHGNQILLRPIETQPTPKVVSKLTRSQPSSPAGQVLLEGILANADESNRGITDILGGFPGDSLSAAYIFTTAAFGHSPVMNMKKRFFRGGIVELLRLGWLHQPEVDHATAVYEFNPE